MVERFYFRQNLIHKILLIIMKKHLLAAVIVIVSSISVFAQTFEQGKKYAHLGIGIGSAYSFSDSKMGIPPIHASLEVGITENIGIGGLVGYTSSKYEQSFLGDSYSWKFSYLILGARGAYHFTTVEQCDLYAGVMLGYNVASAKFESTNSELEKYVTEPKVGGVAYAGFVGARKNIGENFTIFGELGYSIAYLSAGVCFNL